MTSNPDRVMPDELPSADTLTEQAYLVARGVRRLSSPDTVISLMRNPRSRC